jgi:vacuolar-type H+-ATPase subunit E/Vma4
MTLLQRQQAALAPVQTQLLRDAVAQGHRIVADARLDAEARVAAARVRADELVARARADGRSAAGALATTELGRGRQAARAAALDADRRACDALAARIRSAVCGLRDQPGYGEIRERLAALALSAAGPGASVSEHPDGGVLAERPGITVDCSLPRLANLAVAALGPEIRELAAR